MSKLPENCPSSAQVQSLIDDLESVSDMAEKEGALNMDKGTVAGGETKYPCGSVHCVAGWIAVANRKMLGLRIGSSKKHGEKCGVSFMEGVKIACDKLGFHREGAVGITSPLADFMGDHPEIWGNKYGRSIFDASAEAYVIFNKTDDMAVKKPKWRKHIIAQWKTCRDNIAKLEAKAQ